MTSSPCDGVKMPRIERMQMRFLITSGGARWPYVYQPPLDRYGHLFPGSEQKLNDALDALADESPAAAVLASEDAQHAITAE